jgi:hypothetical protein
MKEKEIFVFTRIRSHDTKCISPVCYHRANVSYGVLLLIYIT